MSTPAYNEIMVKGNYVHICGTSIRFDSEDQALEFLLQLTERMMG